ncbi:MAG TPA: glycosyltransferase [Propylenella sp.]
MIFVTVGSMMPFDRLIEAMDQWAAEHKEAEVFAQIGEGAYWPRHMQWARTITPAGFCERVANSDLVVAHAGMGSIIVAAEAGKPIVIMPRVPSARELTTDHQLHTARRLQGHPGIYVATSEAELPSRIQRALNEGPRGVSALPASAPAAFVRRVRDFLLDRAIRQQ